MKMTSSCVKILMSFLERYLKCQTIMSLFNCDVQEELDLLMDGAAGFLPPLCQRPGGQHQLGTYPISPQMLTFL